MAWLVMTSLRRNLGRHWLAVVGLACAVAVSCLGLSGAGLMMRLVRKPVTQLMGGDLMVLDAGVVFRGGSGYVTSESYFAAFSLSELAIVVDRQLPGAPVTAAMFAPCLDASGRPLATGGFGSVLLLGRLDDTGDPLYFPDILTGERLPPGSSPVAIFVPGSERGARYGAVGGDIVLRPALFELGPDGEVWDIAAGEPVTFRVTGIHDQMWFGGWLIVQLADLHALLGADDLATWAGVVHRDAFGLDKAAAKLRGGIADAGLNLQVLTADDFAMLMAADFGRFRRTASFYTVAVILISALIVVASSLSSIYSRKRELALLRTVGLGADQVRQLFLWESTLVSAVGAGVGYLLSALMAGAMLRSVATTPLPALTAVVVTVVVAAASSGSVSTAGVADALRNP
jgi:hypothetical protein